MKMGKHYLRMALQSHDVACLRSIHLYLNQIYYLKMFSEDKTRFITDANIKKLSTVEKEWISYEESQCRKDFDLMQSISMQTVTEALKQHPVYDHALFEYFECFADKNDIKWFFLNESVLNLEFFDFLALALIGASDKARAEIIKKCWRESGEGHIHSFHTTLFRNFLTELKLNYNRDLIIANMPWQGIADINLFSYYAIYPYNKMRFYGLLTAAEVLNPEHHHRLSQGILRIFGENHSPYYEKPALENMIQTSSWLEKIVIPELYEFPEKAKEFWLGFYMRLQSAKQYYDYFSHSMVSIKAA